MKKWLGLACALGLYGPSLFGCSPEETTEGTDAEETQGSEQPRLPDNGRCPTEGDQYEVTTYDTNGDEHHDVRKVFLRVGLAPTERLVLVCREADLNGDGSKDVHRYYSEEGEVLREESDRNFDGRMDEVSYFEDGRIARISEDSNGDGRVDHIRFYERGVLVRAERDLIFASTQPLGHVGSYADGWVPDRWEYFHEGRAIRMGTDFDHDGRIDRWDRDAEYQRELAEEEERQNEEEEE